MDIKIQLIIFLISFLYGFILANLSYLNYKFLQGKSNFFKLLFNLIFTLDVVFVYLVILYKINYGVFHVYFLGILSVGFLIGYKCIKYVKRVVTYCKLKFKMIK